MGNKNLHNGHRERLRAKFSSGALLEEHEILELLLFECIPRSNTNEIAHLLLERFGSIRGVLNAKESELMEIPGIGKRSVFFLRLLPAVIALYQRDGLNTRGLLTNRNDLYTYMQSLFIGSSGEKLYLLLFSANGWLKRVMLLDEGLPASTGVMLNKLLRTITESNATTVVLVHNHPDGIPFPSAEDKRTTDRLAQALLSLGVRLLDHFIIADNTCYSILEGKQTRIDPDLHKTVT